jgi:hypothetical protein
MKRLLLLCVLAGVVSGCQVTVNGNWYDCELKSAVWLVCQPLANPHMHYGPTLPH